MKKLLAALISALLLVGCSGPSGLEPTNHNVPKATDTHCFDVFVQAYATGGSNGAYDCLSPSLQFKYFSRSGVQDDKGLNNFLRLAKDIVGTYDVQEWHKPIPDDVWKDNRKSDGFVPRPGDTTRAYFLFPVQEDGSIGYYTDGYSLLITIDSSGKVVDIE